MLKTVHTTHEAIEEKGSKALKYWGAWASFGWAVLGYGLIILAQFVALFITSSFPLQGAESFANGSTLSSIEKLGWVLGLSFPLALLLITIFVIGVVRLRAGPNLKDYLGWHGIPIGTLLTWLGVTLLFEVGMAGADVWFDRPRSPQFLVQAYAHPGSLLLLWFSIVLAGPIAEEMLFRGLVLPSWAVSWMGPWGAVALVAFLFAAVHIQYDLYNQMLVFLIAVLLGIARIQTGSLLTPIAMHVLINGMGMAVVAYDQIV